MSAKVSYSIAGGIFLGLLVQFVLLFVTQGAEWPGSWIICVAVNLVLSLGIAAVDHVDVAKGVLLAAVARSIYSLIVVYETGVLSGKFPYSLWR